MHVVDGLFECVLEMIQKEAKIYVNAVSQPGSLTVFKVIFDLHFFSSF